MDLRSFLAVIEKVGTKPLPGDSAIHRQIPVFQQPGAYTPPAPSRNKSSPNTGIVATCEWNRQRYKPLGEGVIQRVIKNGFPTEIATLANAYTLTIMGVGSDDISQCNACRIILFHYL
jgi:hypothetical protein